MSGISRREVIRQLGLISAAGSISGMSFAKPKGDRNSRLDAINNDFYVIFPGAWLFSFDSANNAISAITTDRTDHTYQYAVSSDSTVNLTPILINKTYSVQVQGHSAGKPASLIQTMIQNNQGTFFNDQVDLSSTSRNDLRTISFPMPSAIHPAALFMANRGGPLVSADSANTLQSSVIYIPGAVAFVYSGWTSGSLILEGTTLRTFSPSSGGAHLLFRVCPTATCDHPIPCDSNYAAAVTQQEQHAKQVFSDLLGLLAYKAGGPPTLSFPTCAGTDTGITVGLGSDKTLSGLETGMFPDPCGGGKFGTLHTCAAAGLFVGA